MALFRSWSPLRRDFLRSLAFCRRSSRRLRRSLTAAGGRSWLSRFILRLTVSLLLTAVLLLSLSIILLIAAVLLLSLRVTLLIAVVLLLSLTVALLIATVLLLSLRVALLVSAVLLLSLRVALLITAVLLLSLRVTLLITTVLLLSLTVALLVAAVLLRTLRRCEAYSILIVCIMVSVCAVSVLCSVGHFFLLSNAMTCTGFVGWCRSVSGLFHGNR